VGYSTNFVVGESRKSIRSFHNMMGHEAYEKVTRERQG